MRIEISSSIYFKKFIFSIVYNKYERAIEVPSIGYPILGFIIFLFYVVFRERILNYVYIIRYIY